MSIANILFPKRTVFVSYHHKLDQQYYDKFSSLFGLTYEMIRDNSVDRRIDSTNTDYVRWAISQRHITGSSCTIVLLGQETWQRKYVDWEIKATLDKEHGLIGLLLPSNQAIQDRYYVPDRFEANYRTGYALFINWHQLILFPNTLKTYIEQANDNSPTLIDNSHPLKQRNG